MPIAHSSRFIYIHVPKTAGMSLHAALVSAGIELQYDGLGLWDDVLRHSNPSEIVGIIRRFIPVTTLRYFPQQHTPAVVLREFLPAKIWQSYFKCAFVRNPWEMLVSYYHFLKNWEREATPSGWEPDCGQFLSRCPDFTAFVHNYRLLFPLDMTAMFCDTDGTDLVDFVGRVESFEEGMREVGDRIGLRLQPPRENLSEHAPYREYYTDETCAVVAHHFRRDILRFGYEF